LIVPTDNPAALAEALRWTDEHSIEIASWTVNARATALAFGSEVWAARWLGMFERITSNALS
jgi:hypothetical protein